MPRRSVIPLLLLVVLWVGTVGGASKTRPLELHHVRLELPGAPASVLPADLGGGRRGLLIVLAYTELESIGVDRIEDMVQISTVIPALFDRREARVYLADDDGGYEMAGDPLELPPSVLSVAAGSSETPLLALTDEGVSAMRLSSGATPELTLEPLIADRSALARGGRFFSELEWVVELDGDSRKDLLLPSADGPAVYLARDGGFDSRPTQRLQLPGARQLTGSFAGRLYPLPRVEEVTGDGYPDLVLEVPVDDSTELHLLRGQGDGRFTPLHAGKADCARAESLVRVVRTDGSRGTTLDDLEHFGDLDGDGRAEVVSLAEVESEKDGLRAGLKQAKKPRQDLGLHRWRDDGDIVAEPEQRFRVVGHTRFSVLEARSQLFRDLDGDGRKDLVTVTLDFSLLQGLKVLTTKRISIGMDFHVWAQDADGTFAEVAGLDLSEKLKLNLNDLRLGRIAQFAGDFDGDGRIDFVHLGRGKRLTIHRGQPGCRYAVKPDLVVELEEEPQDLGLVEIEDFDGDGLSDLSVTRLLPAERQDVSAPVVLDLYLSRGVP